MTPTPESLRRTADAIEAQETLKPWQYRRIGELGWCNSATSDPIHDFEIWEFRPKPTAKLRPWTFEEVPVGTEVVLRDAKHRRLIVAVYDNSVALGSNACFPVTFEELLRDYRRADGSPCGVESEEA